jgi:hypothetical protein
MKRHRPAPARGRGPAGAQRADAGGHRAPHAPRGDACRHGHRAGPWQRRRPLQADGVESVRCRGDGTGHLRRSFRYHRDGHGGRRRPHVPARGASRLLGQAFGPRLDPAGRLLWGKPPCLPYIEPGLPGRRHVSDWSPSRIECPALAVALPLAPTLKATLGPAYWKGRVCAPSWVASSPIATPEEDLHASLR